MGIRGMTMMSITALLVICIGSSQAFRLDSRIPASRIPNSCVTGTGSTCVFPFKYKNVEYTQCTYAESPLPWCATLTDSSGVVVTGQWGDCQISSSTSCTAPSLSLTSCTTDSGPQSGQSCVFPFRYNGVVYSTCTTEGQAQAWCSTSVDNAGDFQAGQYGFCPSSCPSTGTTSTTTTSTTTSSTTTTTMTSTTTTTTTTTTTACTTTG